MSLFQKSVEKKYLSELDNVILLAIINSKFMNWYFQSIVNPEKGKAMAQVKRGHLQQLPIIEKS